MMQTILLLAAALLPAVLLWLYIWRKDPQKEPTRLLVKAVWYGIGICVPVALLEAGLQEILLGGEPTTLAGTTIMAFGVAALPEELFKLFALWLILRRNPFFDEHFDGIVYAVSVGLGFAAMENIGYLIEGGDEWIGTAIARALLAVPGHYAFAVLMGYYYSIYHFVDHSLRTKICILLVPVVAHGIYDALAMSGMVNETVGSFAFLLLIYFCIKMHKFAYRKMIAQVKRSKEGINPERV
jgi:RsiW-degrading membrane proteinase PrsW (M82 family)